MTYLSRQKFRDRKFFHGKRAIVMYELMARVFGNATDWRFMNYGYAPEGEKPMVAFEAADETERYSAQLYHFVAAQADLLGKTVLDVGSGRGGGASHVHRYLKPAKTVGMDLAEHAVAFCNRVYKDIMGLSYCVGDAMAMPFEAASFDAVLNVESSHCYPDKQAFFAEVLRVLRPGGAFLYTDFTPAGERPDPGLTGAGFEVLAQTNITHGVTRALELDNNRREDQIHKRVPFGLRWFFSLWAGTEKSWIYKDFHDGRRDYVVFHAVKPD